MNHERDDREQFSFGRGWAGVKAARSLFSASVTPLTSGFLLHVCDAHVAIIVDVLLEWRAGTSFVLTCELLFFSSGQVLVWFFACYPEVFQSSGPRLPFVSPCDVVLARPQTTDALSLVKRLGITYSRDRWMDLL